MNVDRLTIDLVAEQTGSDVGVKACRARRVLTP